MQPLVNESLHKFVLRGLKSRGDVSIRAIAEASQVSQRTLEKILSGEIADPGVSHIEKLAAYFRAQANPSSKAAIRA
jgi:transcriptional regulator with XRE-family HTH domain